jgi:hypothetical protein
MDGAESALEGSELEAAGLDTTGLALGGFWADVAMEKNNEPARAAGKSKFQNLRWERDGVERVTLNLIIGGAGDGTSAGYGRG